MLKHKKILIWIFSVLGFIVPLLTTTVLSCAKISDKKNKEKQEEDSSNIKNENQSEKQTNDNKKQDNGSKNKPNIDHKNKNDAKKTINKNQTKNKEIHEILNEIFKVSKIDVKGSFLAKKLIQEVGEKEVMVFLKQHIFENSLFKNAKVYFEKDNLEIISINHHKDNLEVNFFYKTKQKQTFNFLITLYNFKKIKTDTNNHHEPIQEQISLYLQKNDLNYAIYLKSINKEININFLSAPGINLFNVLVYIKSLLPKKLNSLKIDHNLINLTNVRFVENETELNFNLSYQGKIDFKNLLKIKGFVSVKKVATNSKEYLWSVFSKVRKSSSTKKSENKNVIFDINDFLTNANELNLTKLFYNKDLKKQSLKCL